ncbi:MAG: universal stress protein [Candidatus Lokiarchaeota archaeon]|nr:universal stress protein [Candidatus Lokiarchaeota archaeon]
MKAAKRVIEIQKEYGGDVVAFHSVLHGFASRESVKEDDITQGKKVLSDAKKLFKDANLTIETRLIKDVHPEDFIRDAVEKEEFNLVVLGNKGKHKLLRRAVLGSVPTKVMNSVLCDVLVVR